MAATKKQYSIEMHSTLNHTSFKSMKIIVMMTVCYCTVVSKCKALVENNNVQTGLKEMPCVHWATGQVETACNEQYLLSAQRFFFSFYCIDKLPSILTTSEIVIGNIFKFEKFQHLSPDNVLLSV